MFRGFEQCPEGFRPWLLGMRLVRGQPSGRGRSRRQSGPKGWTVPELGNPRRWVVRALGRLKRWARLKYRAVRAEGESRMTGTRGRKAWRSRAVLAGTAGTLMVALLPATGGVPARASDTSRPAAASQSWPVAGQNLSDTHDNTAETAISAANVSQLTTQWSLTTAGDVTATPTVADGVVYFPDRGGKLWAVRAATGKVIWSHSVPGYTGVPGDLSRVSPAITGSELILGDHWENNQHPAGARLYAVSRSTGKLLWLTKVDTNPVSTITGSPVVYDGVAYVGVSSREEELAAQPGYTCCTFRGEIVAVDVTTGKLLWKTYTVPSNNGGGDINKPGAYAGGAVWGSSPVVDPANGMLYVGTGNDYTVPTGVCYNPGQTGCKTPAATDYFDSIL